MAFMTFNGNQVRVKSIEEKHLKSKLTESVLDINYSDVAKAEKLLQQKLLIEAVTYNTPISITSGASKISDIVLSQDVAVDTKSKGIILDELVDIRDADTGEFIVINDKAVYGLLEVTDATAKKYELTFVYDDKTPVTVPYEVDVKMQYYIRADLWNVSERAFKHERLIETPVDITQMQQINQVVADVFGAGYKLNSDGTPNHVFDATDELVGKTMQEVVQNTFNELKNARVDISGKKYSSLVEYINALETELKRVEGEGHVHEEKVIVIKTDDTVSPSDSKIVTFEIVGALSDSIAKVYYNGARQIKDINYKLNTVYAEGKTTITVEFVQDMIGTVENPDYVVVEYCVSK